MHVDRSRKNIVVGTIFLAVCACFIAACGPGGSTSSGGTGASSGASGATATATCPPNLFKTTTGTLQSINGTSLVVHSTQGSTIQASYATTTRFQQETTAKTSALKEGAFITVAVKQDSSGNYTATTITLVANRAGGFGGGAGGNGGFGRGTPGAGGNGGFGGGAGGNGGARPGNANCFRRANGGFGGGAGAGGNGGSAANTLTGTVGQLSGSTLTITDFQGSNYTATISSSTKILQFQTATASALKSGANLTLSGSDNGKGGITAQSITILLPGTTGTAGTAA